jgi:hypothetical protein
VHNAYMERYPVLRTVVANLRLENGSASITTAEVGARRARRSCVCGCVAVWLWLCVCQCVCA